MEKPKPDPKEESKQPFVGKEDRPDVRINLDTPVSELRVRDLGAILSRMIGKDPFEDPLKAFFDKDFPEVNKDPFEKLPLPEKGKSEKLEKPEKPEKEFKHEKVEKEQKHEKVEKPENDGVFTPGFLPIPDPRMQQVIQAISGLAKQVSQLANQVEELRKKTKS